MDAKEFAHGLFLKQRRIAVQNKITGRSAPLAHRKDRAALQDRMAGAQLLSLFNNRHRIAAARS